MKRIAVMGTGYVGLVSGTCFAEVGNEVTCCDVDEHKIAQLKSNVIPFYEPGLSEMVGRNVAAGRLKFTTGIAEALRAAEVIYIAVGTPMSETGEADLAYVRSVAAMIGDNLNSYKIVVTKSTVPVGTGRLIESIIRSSRPDASIAFDVVSNPEFLREGSAVLDCMQMERTVIGARSGRAANVIAELHAPFHTNVLVTDLESAEMIKYAANAFLATKISFINMIANLCEKVGADVTMVAEGMGNDSRIGRKFLQAGIGFGGSCFPKDTEALSRMARHYDCDASLIDAVIRINQGQRQVVVDKLRAAIPELSGKQIAVLGLSFKPDTDDMRCAPSLDIIPALIGLGATVKVYDPVAEEEASKLLGHDGVSYCENVYETLPNSDACVILTEWKEIVDMDLNLFRRLIKQPVLIDGRNCYNLDDMKRHRIRYYSVGRPAVNDESVIGVVV